MLLLVGIRLQKPAAYRGQSFLSISRSLVSFHSVCDTSTNPSSPTADQLEHCSIDPCHQHIQRASQPTNSSSSTCFDRSRSHLPLEKQVRQARQQPPVHNVGGSQSSMLEPRHMYNTALNMISKQQQQQQHHSWLAPIPCLHLQQLQPPQQHLQQQRSMSTQDMLDSAENDTVSQFEGRKRRHADMAHHLQATSQHAFELMEDSSEPVGDVVAPIPLWVSLEQQRQQRQQQQQHKGLKRRHHLQSAQHKYPVHAVHLGAEIDAQGFAHEYRDAFAEIVHQVPPHRDHVIFKLKDCNEDQDLLSSKADAQEANLHYMILYRYGSVIFVNNPRSVRENYLGLLKPFIKLPQGRQASLLDAGSLRSDETTIVVCADLHDWSQLVSDEVIVQKLDVANLRVISHVLSQSVALDYFNSRVDAAIQQFTPYLVSVAQSGQCDSVKEAGLLQLIADNSLMYTDVITKIGLLDISQTAWKQDKHFQLWENLRMDYEIERRFEAINSKLGPMIENAKFLLDVRAEQKSSGAEWIIIGLIMLEVVINTVGHLTTFWWHSP